MKNLYHYLTRQHWLLLLIGALSTALSTNARAQSAIPPVYWQRILDKSVLSDNFQRESVSTLALVRSTDGGCALVAMAQPYASAFITKLNAGGGVEWTTPLQGSPTATSLQATPEGAYMVAKHSNTNPNFIEIERISSTGAIIYRKPVNLSGLPSGTSYQYTLRDLVPSPDGGFLISGYQSITNNPDNPLNILLVKIDQNGNTTWAKTIGNLGSTFLFRANTASEGGYLIHSTTNSRNLTGSPDNTVNVVYSFRIDEQGVTQWQRIGSPSVSFFDFSPTGDGYVAIGSYNGLPGLSVLKLNRTLDIIKATSLADTYLTDASERTSVKPTSDGGCIVVDNYTGNARDYRITRFNSDLAIDWQEKGGGSGDDDARRVVVDPDGTFYIAGTTNSANFPGRTDTSNNTLIWVRKQAAKAPPLTLTAPTYNCATGAFKFNITGGNGTPITYFAPGITGPTTNPNQFVDTELRQAADAKPLSLSATQSRVTATYMFDLRATCPVGTNPPVQTNQDRAILVELYNATNGPNWTNRTNWLQGDSPCNWFGISCNSEGRVVKINLSNNLTGTLPASLGNLSQLQSLIFFQNPLTGTLPASLGNLSQLTSLNIEYTQINGEIPASLGNLSKLKQLFLAQNQLTGIIPASLGKLTQLENLYLFGNSLTKCIPAELASLCGKDVLITSGAKPDSFFTTFCSNGTGTCSTMPTTGNLTLTQPTYNCATGAFKFNTTGGNGTPITYFAPGITGPTTNPNQFVDRELRQAADAKPLSLSATQSGVTATYVFDLRATCPVGTNPPVQTNQDRAALVDLYNSTNGPGWTNKTNWLQGDSPCNWFGVTCDGNGRVTKLNMVNNNMTGVLPASLGNLSQLQSLVIFQNPIVGNLPASLGNLRELTSLNIEYTQISGEIPASLGNLPRLTSLFLAQNQLSGPIPASLGRLAQLENLYLFGNKLTMCIPAELASLCGKDVRLASGAMPDSYFTTFCSNGTGACSTTPTTGLALIAPTYNCATGAFTFNTTGGNGSIIEYQAPGITGWTTNPNQFVDKESRTANDVQPFTLMARQSGIVVTYTWNLKQACGRARVAAEEAGTPLSLQLLGNPVHETVQILIKGAEGQPVQLRLTDVRGRLLESRAIEQAGAQEVQQFKLDPSVGPGMLLLQATQQQQVKTIKIIRQ